MTTPTIAHTPGPWKSGGDYVSAPTVGLYVVAQCYSGCDAGREEARANAALIAAAPDMLFALREIAKGQGAYSRDPFQHACNTIEDMKEIANAAIAKAEGRS